MKILPVTNYNYKQSRLENRPKYALSGRTNLNISQENIAFTGVFGKDLLLNILGRNPLKKLNEFSISEYNQLSKADIKNLRGQYKNLAAANPSFYESLGDIHDFAATAIQVVFDKRFGKDNYTVIPIGRSLSSIGKVLGYKIGEENVVNIPMSDAKRFVSDSFSSQYKEIIENIKCNEGIEEFLEYLGKKHLCRQDIENGGKNYVLMDYCSSGLSLQGAETLFKSDLVWGNRKRNIFAVDFMKLLDNIAFDENSMPEYLRAEIQRTKTGDIKGLIGNILFTSKYKNISFVNHAYNLADTSAACDEAIKSVPKNKKLVWFHLLDNGVANKGVNKFSVKQDEGRSIFELEGQKVEPWNDFFTQYEYDLRNDFNEINKTIIKFNGIDRNKLDTAEKMSQYSRMRLNIYTIYNSLSDYCKDQKKSPKMPTYYIYRDTITEQLNNLNNYLEKFSK